MFDPLRLYRVYHRLWRIGMPVVPPALYRLNRVLTGCDLPPSAAVGRGVVFQHWGTGIAVSPNTVIEDDVVLLPQARLLVPAGHEDAVRIHVGRGAQIGAGAVVFAESSLHIGDGAQIGAGSLVQSSVGAGATVFGCRDIEFRLQCLPAAGSNRPPLVDPRRIHALARWLYVRRIRWLPGLLYRANYVANRCIIGANIEVGKGVRIGRWVQISFTNIGESVRLDHGVIVARNVRRGRASQTDFIEIERGAEIGAGAVIVGADGMRIGEHSRIDKGAVVTKSVPPGFTAYGAPARVVPPARLAEPQ